MKRNSAKFNRFIILQGSDRPVSGRNCGGFSTVELLAALAVVLLLAGLAAPNYLDAAEKRRLTLAASDIVEFVNLARSEAVKRFRPVTVSYRSGPAGRWCMNASIGKQPCNCLETDASKAGYCPKDPAGRTLGDADFQNRNPVLFLMGDGDFVIDPVRGTLTDPADSLSVGLGTGDGRFRLDLSFIVTGDARFCIPEGSESFDRHKGCRAHGSTGR
jgi:type IV fimbrial biogenesis protein FimT